MYIKIIQNFNVSQRKIHKNAHYNSVKRELKETCSFIEEIRLKQGRSQTFGRGGTKRGQ